MNSLYGRFGMDDNFSYFSVINNENYDQWEKENINNIQDVIKM